jgi:uncharacterized protein involved in outer membrane biogenesis
MNYRYQVLSLVVTVALAAVLVAALRNVFYTLVYEDNVKQTVIEMVKKEALNEQQ